MTTTTSTTAAQAIVAASIAQGGGTFFEDGRPATSGIAVTVRVTGKGADLTEVDVQAALDEPDWNDYIGTWFDEENGVWETSRTAVFPAGFRDAALRFAANLGERYVYDLDANDCIAVR